MYWLRTRVMHQAGYSEASVMVKCADGVDREVVKYPSRMAPIVSMQCVSF